MYQKRGLGGGQMKSIVLTASSGSIYLGTEQFLTLVVVLAVLGSILIFLAKHQFSEITNGIKNNYNKTNERIDKLEEKSEKEIADIKKELGDIKGDFATSFVLREDFFRTMNSVEDNIRDTSRKVDKILLLISEKK